MAGSDDNAPPTWPPPEWLTPEEPDPQLPWPPPEWGMGAPEDEVPHALAPAPAPPETQEPPPEAPQWPPAHWQDAAPPLSALAPAPDEISTETPWPPPAWSEEKRMDLARLAARVGAQTPAPEPPGPPSPSPEQLEKAGDAADVITPSWEEKARIAGLTDQELAAEEAEAESGRAIEEARRRSRLAEQQQAAIEEDLVARQKSAAKLQGRLDELNQRWEEHGQQRIDTGRWWSQRSTGQQLAAFAGAAIHGFLNPGGPNQTLQAMQQAIDRDIAAQRVDLETGRAALAGQRGILADYWRITGDMAAATEAARAAGYRAAQTQISADMVAFDPEGTTWRRAERARRQVAAAEAQARAKAVEALRESVRKEREQDRKDRELEHSRWMGKQQVAQGWSRVKLAERKQASAEAAAQAKRDADAAKLAEAEKKAAEKGVVLDPDTGLPMGRIAGASEKVIEQVRDEIKANLSLNRRARELQALYTKAAGRFDLLKQTDRAKIRATRAVLVGKRVRQLYGGNASDAERENVEASIPDARGLFSTAFSDQQSVLQMTVRQENQDLEDSLTARGIPIRDPKTGEYLTEGAGAYFRNREKEAPKAQVSETARTTHKAHETDFDATTNSPFYQGRKIDEAKAKISELVGQAGSSGSSVTREEVRETLKNIGADSRIHPSVRDHAKRMETQLDYLSGNLDLDEHGNIIQK